MAGMRRENLAHRGAEDDPQPKSSSLISSPLSLTLIPGRG